MKLANKVCLITGASSGIGAATARAFAAEGATLVLTARDVRRGEEVVRSCRDLCADALFVAADVTDPRAVDGVVAKAQERFGRVDVLFNNAGVIGDGTVVTTTPEEFRRVMDVNLFGQFLFARAVVPLMQRQGRGVIVNNASDWGLVAGASAVAYCCSKGAVVMLTKAIALDHGGEGIRCNAICPGDTLTPMVLDERAGYAAVSAEELATTAGQEVPLGRMAEPEEIAAVVVFLASADSSFMTGSIVPVDGGNTCR